MGPKCDYGLLPSLKDLNYGPLFQRLFKNGVSMGL